MFFGKCATNSKIENVCLFNNTVQKKKRQQLIRSTKRKWEQRIQIKKDVSVFPQSHCLRQCGTCVSQIFMSNCIFAQYHRPTNFHFSISKNDIYSIGISSCIYFSAGQSSNIRLYSYN